MRVLFLLHGWLSSNSGLHVQGFATGLAALGHEIAIATPGGAGSKAATGGLEVVPVECLAEAWDFPGGHPPDVLHAWTPRSTVVDAVDIARSRWPNTPVVVHLEDDERILTESLTGRRWEDLAADQHWSPTGPWAQLTCVPRRVDALLRSAAAVTCIVDALHAYVPEGVPAVTLWPGVDCTIFRPDLPIADLRAHHGVPADALVLAYAGAVHPANAAEVRSLYDAVELLNRRGVTSVLLRSGMDLAPFLGDDPSWARPFVRSLGWLQRSQVPVLLAAADVLVQPGRAGPYNDRRLPSKLPEFLATGRPVVLPRTNLGLVLDPGVEAVVVDDADAETLADSVAALHADPAGRAAIGAAGRRFAETRLRWDRQVEQLVQVYERALVVR